LFNLFSQNFNQQFASLFNEKVNCIVAVSGGVDSAVLVDLLFKNGIDFIIVHCNFNLRKEESDRDENFVKDLASKYKKSILIKHFDTEKYASENKLTIQIAARKLRYEWFAKLQKLKDLNIDHSENRKDNYFDNLHHYLLTAHHKNDNIETVAFNFFRGTGLQGLTGIKPIDEGRKIIRPLLPFTKNDILKYAIENNILYVEDSSNASNKYTRNSFRNEILPLINKHFDDAEENIFNNISRLNDAFILYQDAIETHKKKLVEKKGEELHIPILKLLKIKGYETVLYEIVNKFGFSSAQVKEIVKLCRSLHNGSFIESSTHKVFYNRNWLILSAKKSITNAHILVKSGEEIVPFEMGVITFTTEKMDKLPFIQKQAKQSNDLAIELVDNSYIEYPLIIRKWKMGDYFYPLGMQKKQKLSRFFINQKLPLTQKENTWIIESNKKIVCVLGLRIDDRFKLKPNTKQVLKICFASNPLLDK
jgi:tRNA(Ile)-lysidine synthase